MADASPAVGLGPDATIALHDAAVRDAAAAPDDSDASDRPDTGVLGNPTGNRSCLGGTYVGDFACVTDPTGVTPVTAMSHASFTLQQESPGGVFTVTNSDFAFELASFVFAGNLSGTLDCATGIFHAEFINAYFSSVLLPVVTPFTGSIDGQLDNTARNLAGSWSLMPDSGALCRGFWSAVLQP